MRDERLPSQLADAGLDVLRFEPVTSQDSAGATNAFRASRWLNAMILASMPLAILAVVAWLAPRKTNAWGVSAQRMIVGKAVDTLPPDLRSFFDENRSYLALHVADPLDAESKTPNEKHNHFIYLDRYGRFP